MKATLELQLSVEVTSNFVIAPQTPKSVGILRGVGQLITGFSLSSIVTVKEQADVPTALVAMAFTVVTPIGKVVPEF